MISLLISLTCLYYATGLPVRDLPKEYTIKGRKLIVDNSLFTPSTVFSRKKAAPGVNTSNAVRRTEHRLTNTLYNASSCKYLKYSTHLSWDTRFPCIWLIPAHILPENLKYVCLQIRMSYLLSGKGRTTSITCNAYGYKHNFANFVWHWHEEEILDMIERSRW